MRKSLSREPRRCKAIGPQPPHRRPNARVTYVPADAVARAFAQGDTGSTLIAEEGFRVNASRRDGPGEAELHVRDTDIFYVLAGSATVITGGEMIGSHEVGPGELRGSGIRDGTVHRIAKCDVFTIPQGVPHWFKSVQAPFRYYVIKSVMPKTTARSSSGGEPRAQ
jgi:mannose-6-phosphate isomerase-like protein (cupin superfamily)